MSQPNHLLFRYPDDFRLESGQVLKGYHLAYHVYGRLNARKDNVAWVFHALTANSDPQAWWPGLVGPGKLLDPQEYFIVCVNMPGSCYGSIGPLEPAGEQGIPFYHDFPLFTIRDMINAYQPLRRSLGVNRIRIGIGGSMGGQQLLQWAVDEPSAFECMIPIATNAKHSPWGKAFNESQRWCIEADPSWRKKSPEAGLEGMKIARSIALLSYRHYDTYHACQADDGSVLPENSRAASYQRHQGEKLARRFNAFSYYQLSRSMDTHHVGSPGTTPEDALRQISARTLVIGLNSDVLFPLPEQQFLARYIPDAGLAAIHSAYGHDGFLLEGEGIEKVVREYFSPDELVPATATGPVKKTEATL
jgi:homoserine O-acetyltransferase/O-succinyltransferase